MTDFQNPVGNSYVNVNYQESFVIYRLLLHQVKELTPSSLYGKYSSILSVFSNV
jgi:hypothetical protein